MNQEPGPITTQSAAVMAASASAEAGGVRGMRRTARTSPGVLAIVACPRSRRISSGASGSGRSRRPRCRAAPSTWAGRGLGRRAAHHVESLDGVAELLQTPPTTGCRSHARPGDHRRRTSTARRRPRGVPHGRRHSAAMAIRRIARRQDGELAPEASGRTTVVGDRDDGRDLAGDATQRLQGGEQPVTAAHRHDARQARTGSHAYSRPRSRCMVWHSMPTRRSRRASSSVMAVDRCLPPVQPIATVACRLPSRR